MIEGQETKVMSVRDAIIEAMSEEMRRDENVFLIGEDVGVYGGDFGTSVGMLEEFGSERVRAKTRYMYGGKGSVPVVFRCAAGSGLCSAAQHSQSLEAWFCHIPGLKVVAPGTPADVKGILKAAIRDNNPVIFLEYKAQYNMKGEVPTSPDFVLPIGKADIKRVGKDVTVVTYGRMLERVLKAADKAAEKGIEVEVVDLMTLAPLDRETIIESVRKTGRVLLVNDAHKTGGFLGEIAASIAESGAFDYLDSRILRLAAEDIPTPYNHSLEVAMLPDVDRIVTYIERLYDKR